MHPLPVAAVVFIYRRRSTFWLTFWLRGELTRFTVYGLRFINPRELSQCFKLIASEQDYTSRFNFANDSFFSLVHSDPG